MPFARLRAGGAALLVLATLALSGGARADEITVFAAASLRDAMTEIAEAWAAGSAHSAVVSLAGSSALARQIQHGAPADVFVSANTAWMDALEADGRLVPGTRADLLSNRLALVGPVGAAPMELGPGAPLAERLDGGRLAMALVQAVPAGIYGKAALESLGLWEAVAPRVAQADNVRAALALVATGEAPLGVVYATDAQAEDDVDVVGLFPEESHPPIVYPAAAVSESEAARKFLRFLRGPEARAAFERLGFAVIAGR